MDNLFKRYSLSKLTPVEIESVERPLPMDTIEKAILEPTPKKAPGPDGFTGELYHNFRN